ncbi:glycosyltransferase family 4 protein [Ornithinibacillus californiensis]|uniref:glycosyltransferase family 4 protein n=1 Tax=Ornithinibacillus californiensis TaxID=161536 RepID=UPI0007EC68A0|nr:glycosyltransferase family 4 protein [Ornithinibacillus californiensis]
MKILHINSNYLYTTLFDKMVEKLNLLGIENTVFMPINGSIKFVIKPKEFVYSPVCFNKFDRYLYYIKQKKIYKSINKTLNLSSFHTIHAHTLFTDGHIAYKLKLEYGIPYVVAVRNTDVNTFFKYRIHLRNLGIKILKEAENIIFLSESYKNLVLNEYINDDDREDILRKTKIIPNGIDEFWFRNKGVPKTVEQNSEIKLLYAGIINKNKNIISTTKAIDSLLKKGYNVRFTIVGRIGDEAVYQKVKDLPYVHYMGPRSKEELLKIYNENHIFIMPSKTETFGLVYAEAISQGLPIIYSKGQGFDKQFEEGLVGYHVDSNNTEDIANRILDVISNYHHISANCIEQCEKFDWSVISNNYFDIYRDTMIKQD